MPRGLSAALQEVRQPAAPYRLVFVPTLWSIKLVLKQSHRCDLTAGPTGGLLASLAGFFRVGQRAARSLPERRSAKFRRAKHLLVQGRRRAQFLVGKGPGIGQETRASRVL